MEQQGITEDTIRQMVGQAPRRWRLGDWTALIEPSKPSTDWALRFPFPETFANICNISCPQRHNQVRVGTDGKPFTYLQGTAHLASSAEEIGSVRAWLNRIGRFVGIRDCLALSFALDFERSNGDPDNPQTQLGALRARVKYAADYDAIEEIIPELVAFCETMPGYDRADLVVSVPPSLVSPAFDFPKKLATGVANERKLPYVAALRTVKDREKVADIRLAEKLDVFRGSVAVGCRDRFKGKNVIIIDDVYQSGVTMNYMGMKLLEAGARAIFGLAVEKTCRNDDNVSGRLS